MVAPSNAAESKKREKIERGAKRRSKRVREKNRKGLRKRGNVEKKEDELKTYCIPCLTLGTPPISRCPS